MNHFIRHKLAPWIVSILCVWLLSACIAPEALLIQPEDSAAAQSAQRNSTVPQTVPSESAPKYYYTKSEAVYQRMTVLGDLFLTSLVPQEREFWLGTDGSGRIRQQYGIPQFFSEADRLAWEEAGVPGMEPLRDQTFSPGEIPFEYYTDLPTDVPALAQHVQEMAEATDNPLAWQMFDYVGALLREMPHPPEMRQMLFQVGSDIEGVEVITQTVDRVGRPAVALSHVGTFNEMTTRRTLFFDPEDYTLLGEEEILLEPAPWFDADPGETIGWITYLVSGWVDSTEDRLEGSGETQSSDVPQPQSALITGFIEQTDGEFGYQMLRPADWTPIHLGTARGYQPADMAGQADRVLLTAASLEALAAIAPEGAQVAPWLEFQQSASFEAWMAQREAAWQRSAQAMNLSFERQVTLPNGALYAVFLPDTEQIQLIAYVVEDERPLVITLEGFGAYSHLETVQEEGLFDDLVTMVQSAQAIERDPENVDPPLENH